MFRLSPGIPVCRRPAPPTHNRPHGLNNSLPTCASQPPGGNVTRREVPAGLLRHLDPPLPRPLKRRMGMAARWARDQTGNVALGGLPPASHCIGRQGQSQFRGARFVPHQKARPSADQPPRMFRYGSPSVGSRAINFTTDGVLGARRMVGAKISHILALTFSRRRFTLGLVKAV
jgi:hypothetical protein